MTDLHWIDQLLLAIASAVVAACAPVLLAWLDKHLKIAKDSALSAQLDDAITAAGRIALDALGSAAAHNPGLDIRNAAIAKGADYALAAAQQAVTTFGISPAVVGSMVAGELAKHLGVASGASPQATSAKPVA